MTNADEEKVGVCEDCKYLTVYEGLDDYGEPSGELVYYCEDLLVPVRLNTFCDKYEEG